MKNSLLLTLLISFILISSCVDNGKIITREYILENGTEHKIELKFYVNENSLFISGNENILENKNDIFSKVETIERGLGNAYSAFGIPDSLIIVFDNIKRASIKCDSTYLSQCTLDGIDKNIFSDLIYTVESKGIYRYIFTEEDYNNAK